MDLLLTISWIPVAIGTVLIIFLVTWLWKVTTSRLPPGPFPLPIVGNLWIFDKGGYFDILTNLSAAYGSVYTLYMGIHRTVVLNKIDVVREALITKQNDFAGRPKLFSFDLLSDGGKDITFSDFGPRWNLQRKIAHSAIRNFASGQKLEKLVYGSVDKVIELFNKQTEPFDPLNHLNLLVYNTICAMCFGKVYDIDDKEFLQLVSSVDELNKLTAEGFNEDYYPSIFRYLPSKKTKRATKLSEAQYMFIERAWTQHNAEFDPGNLQDFTDFLIHHLQITEQSEKEENLLTDAHMIETLGDFFIAGTDTSRYTLHWVLAFLAENTKIQRKMQQQIDSVVGDRIVTLADRVKLPYVEAVLYEAMRLGTVAPDAITHKTLCDTSVAGYQIPKDTRDYQPICSAL